MAGAAVTSARAGRPRDLRLDVFRGLGMFIIFVAHVPHNAWAAWIPAAFGASDATEVFVFCSGAASGLAFGAIFRDRGALMGTARTAFRCWQVYFAHIALFCVVAALLVAFDQIAGTREFYTDRLYILPFLHDPGAHLVGLMTLQYVPNYFDILPMYLVLLAMMPMIAMLGLQNRWLAFALVAGIYLLAQADILWFSAEVMPERRAREWYFNPFAWQLVFFLGFSIAMGWIKAPPVRRALVLAALGVLALNVVLASRLGWDNLAFVWPLREQLAFAFDKTDLGAMRLAHFVALAYLAFALAGPAGSRLSSAGVLGRATLLVRDVGQQALPVFLASMVAAQVAGFALDHVGRTPLPLALVNLAGFAVLIATARTAAFFKSEPWRRERQPARPAEDRVPERASPAL